MKFSLAVAASAVLVSLAATAQAAQVAALVAPDTIAMVDTDAKRVTGTWKLTGLPAPLVGIDVRPADGMLYGLAADGSIVTIDKTGKVAVKSKLQTMLPAGTAATVDFNPVADRLRVIGANGMNLRANIDDGMVTKDGDLKFADADMHKGEKPNIVAGAYTNSYKGATETMLLNIDGTIGGLIRQAPPNDGVLNAIGKHGAKTGHVAFDIVADSKGGNAGWMMIGDTLYSVDLASGKATEAAKISGITGPVWDMAILPAM